MIYNVVLVSGVQQSDSVIYIHIFILFQIFSIMVYHRILNIVLPVLYSRTLLFTHYIHNSLHLLIPNSQSISPLLPLPKPHLGFRLISKRYLVMQNNILMENSQHTSKTLQIKLSVIYLFIYIEVELIYSVVAISAIQQSDSVIPI